MIAVIGDLIPVMLGSLAALSAGAVARFLRLVSTVRSIFNTINDGPWRVLSFGVLRNVNARQIPKKKICPFLVFPP